MRMVMCLNCRRRVGKKDSIAWKKVHLCSLKCLTDYHKSHHCEVCDKLITEQMDWFEKFGKMFCSAECAGKYIWSIIENSFNDEPKKMQGGSER